MIIYIYIYTQYIRKQSTTTHLGVLFGEEVNEAEPSVVSRAGRLLGQTDGLQLSERAERRTRR